MATSAREQRRNEGEEKLAARVRRSVNAVAIALEAAGWTADVDKDGFGNTTLKARRAETPTVEVTWDFIASSNASRFFGGRRGDEAMSVRIGDRFSSASEKVRSAKEDLDLVGARVERIVEAVTIVAARRRAEIDRLKLQRSNMNASKAIAIACNSTLTTSTAVVGKFYETADDPDVVLFKAESRLKKRDAEKLASLLATFEESDS